MRYRLSSLPSVVAAVLVAYSLAPGAAHAQAWVGAKGSVDVNFDYNLGVSDKVVTNTDEEFADAGTTSHQFTISGEYVPLPKLAFNVSLPLMMLKYTGDKVLYPHPGGGTYDDGDLHTTLTDLRLGARYQLLEEPFALSPHIAGSVPLADYETIGNTVAGRGLKALHLGVSVGRLFLDGAYAHALYEFSFVEKFDRTPETARHGQNRSDLAFTLGHLFLDYRLDVHLDLNMRVTHGGVELSEFAEMTADEQTYHDAIMDEHIVLAGGGVGYRVTDTLNLNLSGRLFVTGKNTLNSSVVALGVAWSPR